MDETAVYAWYAAKQGHVAQRVPGQFHRDITVNAPMCDVFLKTLWYVAHDLFERFHAPLETQRRLLEAVLMQNCAHVAETLCSAVQNARCEGKECAVCLGVMDNAVNLRMRDCKHCFHTRCICSWFAQMPSTTLTCPMCRCAVKFN